MKPKSKKKSTVEVIKLGKKGSFKLRRGALHKALGVPLDEKIPASKMEAASHSRNSRVRREVASAKGLEAMNHSR